jgi:hypothetical protein
MKNLFKNGMQSRWFCMFIVLALAGLVLMGCPTPPGPGPDPESTKSSNATLSSITVKGKPASLGTPNAIMDSVVPGTASLLAADTGATSGVLADAKATLTKIVKFAANETTTFAAAFASRDAYNDEAITNGDFFIFLVTAEDGSKLYYRVNVSVASFIYTLGESNVEGYTDINKVKFFISDNYINQVFANTLSYAEFIEAIDGTLITTIDSNNEDMYLYAAEFTEAGSGTLVKYSEGYYLSGDEDDKDIVIELEDAEAPVAVYTPTADNVSGEETASNVSFFISHTNYFYQQNFYSDMTYASIVELLGEPITAIYNYYAGAYLYAGEFTGSKSGTLKKAGIYHSGLTGTEADGSIEIILEDIKDRPSAAIENSPYTITTTANNIMGEDGIPVNETITIRLQNATVVSRMGFNALELGSIDEEEMVDGLYYSVNAEAGDSFIELVITGTPNEASNAEISIVIPDDYLRDDYDSYYSEDLEVSGIVKYNIDKAPDPAIIDDITDFVYQMYEPSYYLDHSSTETFAIIAVLDDDDVEGGTGNGITFSLVEGQGAADNSYFVIDDSYYYGSYLKVGDAPLPAARNYSVRVQVQDNAGKSFAKVISFNVEGLSLLTGFTFDQDENMVLGEVSWPSDYQSIYQGAEIGTFITYGGTPSFTYALVDGAGDTDNGLFKIDNFYTNPTLLADSEELAAREYSILVQVTDETEPAQSITQVVTFDLGYAPSNPDRKAEISYANINASLPNSDDYSEYGATIDTELYISLTNINIDATDYDVETRKVDVSDWFSKTIEGLSYTIEGADYPQMYLNIKVSGTPTETSSDVFTITIPADHLLDSNRNPTITQEMVVQPADEQTELKYNINQTPEFVAMLGETKYTSLDSAVRFATPNNINTDVITILRSFELSSTIDLTAKNVLIKAATDGITISPADGFEGPFFNLPYFGNNYSHLRLGNSETNIHSPTLILDGNNQVGTLIQVGGRANAFMYNGVELRNASNYGIYLKGEGTYGDAVLQMDGGVIAGCGTGVYVYDSSRFTMTNGIIYGASSDPENANNTSIYVGSSNRLSSATAFGNTLHKEMSTSSYTETFGTHPDEL